LDSLFYEHTLIDSTCNAAFFSIIEAEIERCQSVILLLGFWEEYAPEQWHRIGGHYVTCAGVNSDSMLIMISDPDYDEQPTDYPYFDPKWHNNAALVSHDIYQIAPSPSPGGYWGLPWYPVYLVAPRHQLENCPDHLEAYENAWLGGPLYAEIEGAVLISPLDPPEAVKDLEIHTAFGTLLPFTKDLRLIWSPVTTDTAGRPMMIDTYVIYRDDVPGFVPDPSTEWATVSDTTYVDFNAAGDSSENYFYIVRARAGGIESADSGVVGEFDKDMLNDPPKGESPSRSKIE
jgi:hypothetical protein